MLSRTNSTVLTRRKSSLTLRVRGKVPVPRQQCFIPIAPRFPLEIIERIIELMHSAHPCLDSCLPAIASVTQTSKALREIALRLCFHDVVVDSRSHFLEVWNSLTIEKEVFGVDGSFNWVKAFFGSSQVIMRGVKNVGAFNNLRTLDMCFASEGLRTQDLIIALLFDSFDQSPARANLNSLAFMNIPRIDTKLLDLIAKTFPQLTELELTSTARIDTDCCLVCVEASLGSTRYSPIPDHYLDAQMLAVNAFMLLSHKTPPLKNLEELYLGIYLSDASMLEEHVTHVDGDLGGRDFIVRLPNCLVCEGPLQEARKRETIVSTILASALPSLIKIRWDTLFLPAKKNEGNDADGYHFQDEEERHICSRMPYTAVFNFAKTNGEASLVREWRF